MNQTCKVCGEPAAGFHFGAFTCEGCKSFFGRSYNNLSSISECKNNGECVINKKNRTACKACRLRKCLLVGMSKSGSRYGRRSNWFKIHCLLQEQHQQATVHGIQKSSSSSAASLAMLGHPGAFASGMYGTRPNCSKEELMLLGLEEYKPNVASPSVSSPDSHNSDSSVDLNIRSNNSMRLGKATDAAQNLGKDIFLQLPFPSLATLPVMPPPGLFPPSHLLFAGYHPSLYPHHQNLLRNPADRQIPHLMNSSNSINNSNHYGLLRNSYNNNGRSNNTNSDSSCSNNIKLKESGSAEELSKCFYLDAVLKSSQESSALLKTSDGNSQIESKSKRIVRIPGASSEIEGENHDIDPTGVTVVMTPPRSPSEDIQNNPIDLSMKGESMSCKSDTPSIDYNRNLSGCESDAFTEDEDEISITTAETTIQKRRQSSDMDTTGTGSNIGDYNLHTEDGIETPCESDLKRMKMQVITPVDLTTKF